MIVEKKYREKKHGDQRKLFHSKRTQKKDKEKDGNRNSGDVAEWQRAHSCSMVCFALRTTCAARREQEKFFRPGPGRSKQRIVHGTLRVHSGNFLDRYRTTRI